MIEVKTWAFALTWLNYFAARKHLVAKMLLEARNQTLCSNEKIRVQSNCTNEAARL